MVLSHEKMPKPHWQQKYQQECKALYYPIRSQVRVSSEVLHKRRYPLVKEKVKIKTRVF